MIALIPITLHFYLPSLFTESRLVSQKPTNPHIGRETMQAEMHALESNDT